MSDAVLADGQPMLTTSAIVVLVAVVIVLTTVVVLALALLDGRSRPDEETSDLGLALLDAA